MLQPAYHNASELKIDGNMVGVHAFSSIWRKIGLHISKTSRSSARVSFDATPVDPRDEALRVTLHWPEVVTFMDDF